MKGHIIKKLRKDNDLTQEELAKKLNISKSTIAMIESNRRDGSREILNKLSNFFNVSLDYLEGNNLKNIDKTYDENISLVSYVLEYLVDINAIDDTDDLSEDIKQIIFNAVKVELSLILSKKNKCTDKSMSNCSIK